MATGIGILYQPIKVTLNAAPSVASVAKLKSNTPVANPMVAPIAITVVIEIDFKIVTILLGVKNTLGAPIAKMINAIITAMTTPPLLTSFFAVILPFIITSSS